MASLTDNAFWLAIVLTVCSLCFAAQGTAFSGTEEYPQRIVSLGPTNTENVYLLGAEDRLVGTTLYCVRPPEARDTFKVGTVMNVSLERVISVKPDLLLTTGLTQPGQIKNLRDLGYRLAHFPQPSSFEEICQQFLQLGQILGLSQRAGPIVDAIGKRALSIQSQLSVLSKPRVLLQIGADPLYIAGHDTFMNDYITLGGGTNPFDNKPSRQINYEEVIAQNPEVIIIAIMGSETGIAAQEKAKWQKLTVISAVKNDRIHIIDPDLACSPSPKTFLQALKIISQLLHPAPIHNQPGLAP